MMHSSNRGFAGLLQVAGIPLLAVAGVMTYFILPSLEIRAVVRPDGLPRPEMLLPLAGASGILGLGLVARRKWAATLLAILSLAIGISGAVDMIRGALLRDTPIRLALALGWVLVGAAPAALAWLGWGSLKWR